MFLYLGEDTVITDKNIIGIFDMDTSTVNKATRDYLNKAQKDGRVVYVNYDLPKSFVVMIWKMPAKVAEIGFCGFCRSKKNRRPP